jgi:hypothetical protein
MAFVEFFIACWTWFSFFSSPSGEIAMTWHPLSVSKAHFVAAGAILMKFGEDTFGQYAQSFF